jgi:hypothetical protein
MRLVGIRNPTLPSRVPERQAHTCTILWREEFWEKLPKVLILVKGGGERGIRTLDGIAPKPHFQFALEEGSEGLLAPSEVRCRCLEDA